MKVRYLSDSDRPTLESWAKASGYPYIDPSTAMVVVDDNDKPLMACAANQIVELYLWADAEQPPTVKLHAMRMLHDVMGPGLKKQGYYEANAFIPPEIARKFGRRLMKTFGWVKNWESYCRKL